MLRFSALGLVLVLAACSHAMPVKTPELTFGPSYRLNVASIKVTEDYTPVKKLPHVETAGDLSPDQALRQWAAARLTAAGTADMLEVNIKEASIIRKELPKQESGVTGLLTKEQTEEYTGTLEVELKIYGQRILPVARIDVVAHQSRSLREDATLEDRRRMVHLVSVELMNALSPELDKNIRQYFANYMM